MTAQLIDGKALALKLQDEIKEAVCTLTRAGNMPPGLAVIQVGSDPASQIYVNHKRRACENVGMQSFKHDLPSTTSEQTLLTLIKQLNNDKTVHGILVQLPLPKAIKQATIVEAIAPHKDVDGFHPFNLGRLAQRRPLLRPCTPFGIMALLDSLPIEIKGKHAVIIGASNIVGRPMALELLLAGVTTTICHRFTQNLNTHVLQADIVIAAVGKPQLVKAEWIKSGAVVIDVGMNRSNNKIMGDVAFNAAQENAAFITPVPGGVGPMTVTMLLKNTLIAYQASQKQASCE